MRRALLLAGAAVALAGCGERTEVTVAPSPRPVTVVLPGGPSGLYAPVYTALADGDFTRAGLAVRVAPSGGGIVVQSAPQLLSARAGGSQDVTVGALVQSAPAAVTVRGSDAAYALMRRDAAALAAHGTPPPYVPLALVVTLPQAQSDGPLLRAFLEALMEGAQSARANPHAATAAVLAAGHGLDGRFELALTQATMAVAFPTDTTLPYGFQQESQWQTLGEWMTSKGLQAGAPAVTNEFLPGQGE
jgi:ABC-type nitrate/sulfonate/bicarbonate transport system substrate-binding protein